jgi:hypothetical protein
MNAPKTTMVKSQSSKHHRVAESMVEDLWLNFGRERPFQRQALHEEDPTFHALLGCAPNVVLSLWNKLVTTDLIPEGRAMKHLLWRSRSRLGS